MAPRVPSRCTRAGCAPGMIGWSVSWSTRAWCAPRGCPTEPGGRQVIDRVQAHLEAIYGLTCEARAEVFLVDSEAALLLGSTGRSEEELLVREEDGEVEVALYLAPALLRRLEPYAGAP